MSKQSSRRSSHPPQDLVKLLRRHRFSHPPEPGMRSAKGRGAGPGENPATTAKKLLQAQHAVAVGVPLSRHLQGRPIAGDVIEGCDDARSAPPRRRGRRRRNQGSENLDQAVEVPSAAMSAS
ncbi:hypothetical protein HPP92_012116 [Vanilla planifolia]|uniref:Uncharacterized protein n=1 Tax=Vanilla planifolia TaxID=51239 RepID=A0A835R894_VANPL|nr:hypothetical protein HPP92_012556 [Vanilla planifolia]KAG0484032.1 hypothetical protein HPP92_012116 [Vanilla planifolia]